MKPLNNLTCIPAHLRRIAKSIFSLKEYSRGRTTSSGLSRLNAPAISIALGVLLVSWTLSASMFSRGGSVAAFAESITTYDLNSCANPSAIPKPSFVLGDRVWATVTGAPGAPIFGIPQRRFQWIAPDFTLAQQTDATSATACDPYDIPTTGHFAQAGTWIVRTVDNSANGVVFATFVVRDPDVAKADVYVSVFGPSRGSAGGSLTYRVDVTNKGPDTAQNITLTDPVPANTTFVSSTAPCTDPTPPGCAIGSLAAGDTASFTFIYNINAGTPTETLISNTVQVSSSTAEPSTASEANNSSTSVASVINQTATTCTISCPADIEADNSPNLCTAVVSYTNPTPSGSCTDATTGQPASVTCNPPSGSVFPIGATAVTCSIQTEGTSVTGNSCSFTVTVHDTRNPVQPTISCPSDVITNENSPGSDSAIVDYPAPSITGNCVTASCDPPAGSGFRVGTTTVTCTAVDSSNNTVTCSFNVVVNPNTCSLDCPDNKTVNESSPGSGSALVTYPTPTTSGSCPVLTITCSPSSGSSFPVGTTNVSCIGKDGSNNVVAACGFAVTVIGSSACSITCPANITASANPPGSSSATVTYNQPTGNCATVSCSPASGSTFPIGTTMVHCNGTDPGGNFVSCTFTVTVIGGTPCVITCPASISQPSDSGGCTKVVTYSSPTTSGSCGDPANPNPWSCNPPSGSVFAVGTTVVTCSTDVGTECSFNVTITGTDTAAPVITSCATPTFALADSTCQGPVPNVTSDVEATDNCTPTDLLTITQSPASGTLVGTGTTTIIVTVKDANNNSSTCTTTFTLFETTPPIALCKPYTAVLDATGNVSITGANVDNGSTDNCAIASRTVTPSAFTCANKGPNTVTLTVTDPSNNSASCQTTVTVVDNTPPTVSCPANIARSNDAGQCTAVVTYTTPTPSDNCPGATASCVPTSGSVFPKGTTTVNCTATDASNNTSSCSFSVTVNDTEAPTIACPANKTLEPTCPTGAVATYTAPVGTDNCPGATTVRTGGPASGSVFPIGTTTVTYTVTDTSNNSTSCSFTVTVLTVQATIQNMMTSVQALQPPLSGQQVQGLSSKLQAALDAVNTGKTNVACNKLADFSSQLSGFISNGTLTSAQGQPLLDSAAHVRNTIGCTTLGCS